jgi:hypothetical protein
MPVNSLPENSVRVTEFSVTHYRLSCDVELKQAMQSIRIVLIKSVIWSTAEKGDRVLAPEASCRVLFESLGTSEKAVRVLSQQNGHRVDYDHQELIIGEAAQAEV